MADEFAVRVEGLRELRRDLRQLQPDAAKEIRTVLKGAAEIVAAAARADAPRKTGRLADSIRGTTAGDRGVVRSKLPYANVQHWGGTIAPRGTPIRIRATEFVAKNLERRAEHIVEAIGDGIERAAQKNGW